MDKQDSDSAVVMGHDLGRFNGEELRDREDIFLGNLQAFFQHHGDSQSFQDLKEARYYLRQPLLLVIVGEYNAGKSALINAILGQEIVETDVTPTTDVITILSSQRRQRRDAAVPESLDKMQLSWITVDHPRLNNLAIVDTPGTNSLIDRHQIVTQDFIPRADLVLFVSSCQQPLTASEREFLMLIHGQWKRKLLMVLNKKDLLTDAEVAKVVAWTQDNVKSMLHERLSLLVVSARQALSGRLAGDDQAVAASGISTLERELFERLDDRERWQLKLGTPLSVIDRMISDRTERVEQQIMTLHEELQGITTIENRTAESATRIKELLDAYIPAIETPFLRFEQNCSRFIDQRITVPTLIRMKISGLSLDREFHEQVFSDPYFRSEFDSAIDAAVSFVLRELTRFHRESARSVEENIRRFAEKRRELSVFPEYDHVSLHQGLKSLGDVSFREFNADEESARIRDSISQAIRQFLGIEAFSGGVIAVFLATAMHDLTGILLGTALASLGFTILPRKRARIKREFSHRITEIAGKVKASLTKGLHGEIEESLQRFKSGISPYVNLCRSDLSQANEMQEQLTAFRTELRAFRSEIDDLSTPPSTEAQ